MAEVRSQPSAHLTGRRGRCKLVQAIVGYETVSFDRPQSPGKRGSRTSSLQYSVFAKDCAKVGSFALSYHPTRQLNRGIGDRSERNRPILAQKMVQDAKFELAQQRQANAAAQKQAAAKVAAEQQKEEERTKLAHAEGLDTFQRAFGAWMELLRQVVHATNSRPDELSL